MMTRIPMIAAIACLAMPVSALANEQEIDKARERELTCSLVYKNVGCDEIFAAEDQREKATIAGVPTRGALTVAQLRERAAGNAPGPKRTAMTTPRPRTSNLAAPTKVASPAGRRVSPSRPVDGAVEVAKDVVGRANLFVTFRLGSAELETSARNDIDTLASVIKKGGIDGAPLRLRIAGHTDATGDDSVNEKLSAERAAAVRQALIDRGVDEKQLESAGYGSAQPVDGYAPTHGINRRVEAVVID